MSKHTHDQNLCPWCNGHRETLPIGMCKLHAAAPDMLATLNAIAARRRGEWDHPDLVAMGPISVDRNTQEDEWIYAAIAKATTPSKE